MCQLQSCDSDYLVVPLVEPDGTHCITCITITLLCFNLHAYSFMYIFARIESQDISA